MVEKAPPPPKAWCVCVCPRSISGLAFDRIGESPAAATRGRQQQQLVPLGRPPEFS